jgi:hypothetical protein
MTDRPAYAAHVKPLAKRGENLFSSKTIGQRADSKMSLFETATDDENRGALSRIRSQGLGSPILLDITTPLAYEPTIKFRLRKRMNPRSRCLDPIVLKSIHTVA